MADRIRFEVMPSPRCCFIASESPLVVCNRAASWVPLVAVPGVTPFWCAAHKPQSAAIAAGVQVVRRVSVVAQIILASSVETDHLARAEAVARLDRGVRVAGGLLNLHVVTCQTGPWAVPWPPGSENGDRGVL